MTNSWTDAKTINKPIKYLATEGLTRLPAATKFPAMRRIAATFLTTNY